MGIICFHNPDDEYGFLSNWDLSDFEVDGIKFTSLEQYMMYKKAVAFDDFAVADKILATSDVKKIKALGRTVHNYNDTVWNGIRQIVVYEGLMAKFNQNPELKEKLLATGDEILAEAAKGDTVWGIGTTLREKARLDMDKWKGQNLLGFSLMLVRDELRKDLSD